MNMSTERALLISIAGKDRVGVVSSVTGYLFEIGANLADTAYAVLGEGFELSCVADLDNLMTAEELEEGLIALPALKDTRINVVNFPFRTQRDTAGEISHILELEGGDRAGLVSRISDLLQQYDANIVRMNSRIIDGAKGKSQKADQDEGAYRMRFALNIPADKVTALDNAVANTAGSMRLRVDLKALV